MKKVLVILMTLVMVFAMTACGGGTSAGGAGATITVEIEIDYPDGSGIVDVEDMRVEIAEGGSVLDALNAYSEASGCEILMDENATPPYVIGIGGVEATDSAGWVYEVNDQMVMESADACVLNAGDEICWEFESWM